MTEIQTAQAQPEQLCQDGHEFITIPDGHETVTRGANTFAKSVPCPRCGKVFKLMAVRTRDGAGYLPEHHTQEWHTAQKRAPKEPTTQVTLQEGETESVTAAEPFGPEAQPQTQAHPRPRRSRSRKAVSA
jgi:hypothetical protein